MCCCWRSQPNRRSRYRSLHLWYLVRYPSQMIQSNHDSIERRQKAIMAPEPPPQVQACHWFWMKPKQQQDKLNSGKRGWWGRRALDRRAQDGPVTGDEWWIDDALSTLTVSRHHHQSDGSRLPTGNSSSVLKSVNGQRWIQDGIWNSTFLIGLETMFEVMYEIYICKLDSRGSTRSINDSSTSSSWE